MSEPIKQNPDQSRLTARIAAEQVVRRLQGAGFIAYFAGGCVRDQLLGLEPTDFDVATDARPDGVEALFPRLRQVGEAFGVMLIRWHGHQIEVASFRVDGLYSDQRRPDEITFTDAEHDAQRRDFTINGMFYDPVTETVIDFVEGREDLKNRVIRAIGDPRARFGEDHLRVLRAVRFAARFGFTIESNTAEAIREGDLSGVSRERIGQEVRLMLINPNRAVAAWEMQYYGLDQQVLNESSCLLAPTRLSRLPEEVSYSTALAAWWLDRKTPPQNLELMSALPTTTPNAVDDSRGWTKALTLSNAEGGNLEACLRAYRQIMTKWDRAGVAWQKRLAATDAFREAIMLVQTVHPARFVEVRRRVSHLEKTGLAPIPLITGEDLIQMGLPPGPQFKSVLEAVYDAQLEGLVSTKEEGIRMAGHIHHTISE